ncbi:hypothetical protein MJT46_009027 [Ovis ammon polii x Ovis aries]|nr:hypothetical protein MJT46_009027 [Ovis ammon polii x Ovis aries]
MEDRSEVQASSWPRPKRSVAVRGSGQLVASKARETAVSFSEESAQPRRGVPYGRELLPPGGEGQRLGRSFRFCVLLDLDSRPKGHLVHFTVDLRSPNAGMLSSVRGDHLGHRDSAPAPRPTEQEISEQRAGDRCLSHGEVSLPSGRLTTRQGDSQEQVSDVQLWSRALDARPLWIAWILAIGEAEVFRHLSFDVRYRLLCAAAVMPVCRESDVPRRIECVLDQDACSIGFEPEILSQCPQQQSRCSQANWGPRKPDTEDVNQQWSLQEQSLRHQHSCAVEELRIPIASQKAAAISFSPEVPNPQRSAKFPSD